MLPYVCDATNRRHCWFSGSVNRTASGAGSRAGSAKKPVRRRRRRGHCSANGSMRRHARCATAEMRLAAIVLPHCRAEFFRTEVRTTICSRAFASGFPARRCRLSQRSTADQVWQLVSYLRSLSGSVASAANPRSAGDAAAGENLFFGKAACAACHAVNSRGANVGPDLSNAGRIARRGSAPEDRRSRRQHESRRPRRPQHSDRANQVTARKSAASGAPKTAFLLVMTDHPASCSGWTSAIFPDQRTEPNSLMPADYANAFRPPKSRTWWPT